MAQNDSIKATRSNFVCRRLDEFALVVYLRLISRVIAGDDEPDPSSS